MAENLLGYVYERAKLASWAGKSVLDGLNSPANPLSGPKFWQVISHLTIRPSHPASHFGPQRPPDIQPQLTRETQGEQ